MRTSVNLRSVARRAVDPRVVGGVLVMAVSAYLGLVLTAQRAEPVLVAHATRDLPAGMALQPDDVELREVVVDDPQRYLGAGEAVGSLSSRVAQGELVPRSALAAERSDLRLVTVPVDAGRLPPDLGRGSVVDVWGQGSDPVLAGVGVVGVTDPQRWAGSSASVVLAVPPRDVPRVLEAARAGSLDLAAYGDRS